MIAVTIHPEGTEAKVQLASHNWQDILRVSEGKVTREHKELFDQFALKDAEKTQRIAIYKAHEAVGLRLVTKTINGKVVHVLQESLGLSYHTDNLKTTAQSRRLKAVLEIFYLNTSLRYS